MKFVNLFEICYQGRRFLNSFCFVLFLVFCVQGVRCLNSLGEFTLSGDYD